MPYIQTMYNSMKQNETLNQQQANAQTRLDEQRKYEENLYNQRKAEEEKQYDKRKSDDRAQDKIDYQEKLDEVSENVSDWFEGE